MDEKKLKRLVLWRIGLLIVCLIAALFTIAYLHGIANAP